MADDRDDPADLARRLIRTADRAVLSTAHHGDGWPYGSLVMVACDRRARPLLLISELAEHTRNLAADARAALLYDGTAGLENPLTGPRVTVLGRFAPTDDATLVARYVARHPDAEIYLGFADFHLYEMTVERAHIVAGFGAIQWIDADELLLTPSAGEPLAAAESDILMEINDQRTGEARLLVTALLGLGDGDWRMTGIDPEGIDLRAGGLVARIGFENPVGDETAAREALAALADRARASDRR